MKNILLTPLKLVYLLLMVLKSCLSIIALFIYTRLERLYKFATTKPLAIELNRREQQELDIEDALTRAMFTLIFCLISIIYLIYYLDTH
jgi:hypothetical protein